MLATVDLFRNRKDNEESGGEADAGDGGDGFGEEIGDGYAEKDEEDGGDADGDFGFSDGDVGRDLPSAFAFVFETQDEHGEAVESEAPDDAESVGFAEEVDVAAAVEDGEELKDHHHVDNAVAGAVALVRDSEPVGEDAVLGDAVEDAVGADDGGVDGTGEDEESDDDDESAEGEAEDVGADHVHGEAGDEVVLVDGDADGVGDEHHREQGSEAGEEEAVDGDDDGGSLEVLELGVGDFAVDLGEGFFAAHGEDGVAEGDEDAEEAHEVGEVGVLEESERAVVEMQVGGSGPGDGLVAVLQDGDQRPTEEDDHHDGGDLHDAKGFFAGFVETFGVLPPVVNGYGQGEADGEEILGDVRLAVEHGLKGSGEPAVGVHGG